jgi:hypothetical protein
VVPGAGSNAAAAARAAGALGPAAAARQAGGAAPGAPAGAAGTAQDSFSQLLRMQAEGQAFNVKYLSLQENLQRENRQFTALSNVLKARHETAQSAISNIR